MAGLEVTGAGATGPDGAGPNEVGLNPAGRADSNLPPYEGALLQAMAFFLGRDVSAQARACLCMYLRQSEGRVMGQLRYFAHQASLRAGRSISEYELLDLIVQNPTAAAQLLPDRSGVHDPEQRDVFS